MSKFFEFLKIGGGMLAAYIFVVTIGSQLFLPNSPKINQDYVASLRAFPSYMKVQTQSLASIFGNKDAAVQKQVDEFKKKTGAVEIAVSKEEQKKIIDNSGMKENPAPGAVFEYVAKGMSVAAKSAKAEGKQEVVVRIDPNTNIQYRKFEIPDKDNPGKMKEIEIMLLP